jgi:hypothetical protein
MRQKGNNVMKKIPLRVTGMALLLMLLIVSSVVADSGTGRRARLTLLNGTSRIVQLDGVGCSESICSRVAIKGRTERGSLVEMRLDTVAAIRRTAGGDSVFVLKDGTIRRLSLVPDFRVLYVTRGPSAEKIDLATVTSIEFLQSEK